MKSLKIILPIGLVLCFITGITTGNIHKNAEKSLSNEEAISAAVNRGILSEREALEDYERERRRARDDYYFKRRIGLVD